MIHHLINLNEILGHKKSITIPDCLKFEITTNACRGYCESWSLPSIMLGFKRHPVTSLGQCCNIMESEDVSISFYIEEDTLNRYQGVSYHIFVCIPILIPKIKKYILLFLMSTYITAFITISLIYM